MTIEIRFLGYCYYSAVVQFSEDLAHRRRNSVHVTTYLIQVLLMYQLIYIRGVNLYGLYSNCCQFAMTSAMLREHESKLSVTLSCVLCVYCIWVVTAGSYTKIVFCNGVDNL